MFYVPFEKKGQNMYSLRDIDCVCTNKPIFINTLSKKMKTRKRAKMYVGKSNMRNATVLYDNNTVDNAAMLPPASS